jgi:hypothetical protein
VTEKEEDEFYETLPIAAFHFGVCEGGDGNVHLIVSDESGAPFGLACMDRAEVLNLIGDLVQLVGVTLPADWQANKRMN